jgi:acetyltransferase-like isoleucine patch superfamily enzyme
MISPFARIDPEAKIGENVTIGDFTIVHANVEVGDDCTIESHCIIGYPTPLAGGMPLRIGSGALIRSHSVIYSGTTIQERLSTGHHVVIREKSQVGRRCQIGSYTELQGDLEFGDYSRTQSSVFIPKHSRIGKAVWLLPRVTLTNDPHPPSDPGDLGVRIEDYAVLAANSTVLPGVTIGTRALVAASSLVTRDVEPDTVVAGVPAKKRGLTREIFLKNGSGESAYPWMRHFHRGYPEDLVNAWIAEYGSQSNES